MKKSKKIKYSNANIDSIEEEFMRELKYDNNAKVSYSHLHTQLDIAVYLFINFEISKQAIIELMQLID
jgi:ribosomal protein S6